MSTNDNNTNVNNGMQSFVNLFEDYSQKIYMEGYLMHQDKKYFVELCGTTLALWDIERPGEVVTPDYIPIMVDTKAYPSLRQQFTLELSHKKKNMVFDTLDPASLTKWICAIRLACFERQLLNRFFTLHLFLLTETTNKSINTTSTSSSGYLQVLLPNNKNEWKKLWVVVSDSNSNHHDTIGRKSKLLQQKQDPTTFTPQFILLDNKKSKTPLLTLKRVDHAYAVYPESASLICQSTLIRLEGVQQDNQPMDILLMADSSNHMTQWLSTLYNAFKLYGRPQSLVQDSMNPVALNFGELLPKNDENGLGCIGNWWLDTEDVIQDMDIFTTMDNLEMYQLLVGLLQQKQSSVLQKQQQQQQSSTSSPSASISTSNAAYPHHHYPQQRANSLPLITVETIECPRQRSTSDAGILNEPSLRSALHSQVADSSDESDDNQDDDDDDDFEDEADSDDEPIGKSKSTVLQKSSSKKAFSSLLIPDFDFGNGFDTDRSGSACSSIMLSGTPSPSSSDVINRPSSRLNQRPSMQGRQHSSSSTTISSGNSDTGGKKTSTAPAPVSSLFGDFSLPTDFNKYLDPSTKPHSSRLSTPDRKYSLPTNVKLYNSTSSNNSPAMSNSSFYERRSSSWDDYGNGWDDRSPRARYLDEDYIYQEGDDDEDDEDDKTGGYDDDLDDYEQDGPLIPSLNDHFAPRNSLLDTHAGEQLSAKEQIEYARATGQPLIQMPSKPRPPKGGLVGVISQREKNRRQGNGMRVAERVNQHHVDRFEREKERRIMEQRQQQYMKHQIMMYAANGYVHPMMMHPYMTQPQPPMCPPSPSTAPMMPSNSPYPTSSPLTPTSSYGRPYSPSGNSYFGINNNNNTMYPSALPHQPFIMNNGSTSTERRNSRPLLSSEEDGEDEPLYSPFIAYPHLQHEQQYPRTMSPPFYHNMNPVPSSSTGSSSVHL
ncbi:hypothetical protein BC941DRAFT_448268 [Chlamydoabsidia padenii]|nr:hypothetical protein BC941DRAFT_448268 [Chlamydoabsidia padenii]